MILFRLKTKLLVIIIRHPIRSVSVDFDLSVCLEVFD